MEDVFSFRAEVYREGNTNSYVTVVVADLNAYVDSWLHIALVWFNDPRFEVYFDGNTKNVLPPAGYSNFVWPVVANAGLMYVGKGSTADVALQFHSASMIFDELILHDRPLGGAEVLNIYFWEQ